MDASNSATSPTFPTGTRRTLKSVVQAMVADRRETKTEETPTVDGVHTTDPTGDRLASLLKKLEVVAENDEDLFNLNSFVGIVMSTVEAYQNVPVENVNPEAETESALIDSSRAMIQSTCAQFVEPDQLDHFVAFVNKSIPPELFKLLISPSAADSKALSVVKPSDAAVFLDQTIDLMHSHRIAQKYEVTPEEIHQAQVACGVLTAAIQAECQPVEIEEVTSVTIGNLQEIIKASEPLLQLANEGDKPSDDEFFTRLFAIKRDLASKAFTFADDMMDHLESEGLPVFDVVCILTQILQLLEEVEEYQTNFDKYADMYAVKVGKVLPRVIASEGLSNNAVGLRKSAAEHIEYLVKEAGRKEA